MKIPTMEQREITKYTGCLLPCRYDEYSLVGSPVDGIGFNHNLGIGIMFGSGTINVAREEKIYPLECFIAEFGGCLGLFLGFSFLMAVDFIEVHLQKMKQFLTHSQ